MPKIDPAHKATEQRIEELERKIRKEYAEAERGVQERLLDHWGAFQIKDEKKRAQVKAGKLSDAEYQHWRTGQIAVGKRWEDMRKTIAQDYMNANNIARKIADDSKADVFAINGNYAFYEIEKNAGIDMSFSLYNHDGVVRLIRDNPDVLPPLSRYGENNPVKRAIREGRIQAWEEGKIQSALVQGIVQGMTIPQLTHHISEHVGALNEASARRYARTAMTGAQNAGRYESYRRAKELGVDLVVEWNAILDRRTRRTHRHMHGERHEVNEPFEIDGHEILYPGYPLALDELIWNCRCTLLSWVRGYEPETVKESPGMEGMTFEEWQNAKAPKGKKEAGSVTKEKTKTNNNNNNTKQIDKKFIIVKDDKMLYDGRATLSEKQKDYLNQYSVMSGTINSYLRMPDKLESLKEMEIIKDGIPAIDKAIAESTVKENIKVFRTVDRNYIPDKLTVGDVIEDKAYNSTSIKKDVIEKLSEKWSFVERSTLEIHVPAGKGKGIYIHDIASADDQFEFLIKRKSRYRVKEIKKDGTIVVIML